MVDQHFPGSHHGFDDLERWLERNERFWVPVVVLILLVMVAFALSSVGHFYANSAIALTPTEW
jgi:hypothetical protein